MQDGFTCSDCSEFHEGLPLDYGARFPSYYYEVPEDEREKRVDITDDICVVDNEFFFVRGRIEIPIIDSDSVFVWGVWCSLSRESFERTLDLWDAENREDEPPYFGWLNTHLPCYPDTIGLKTNVYEQSIGTRPLVELEPTEHPLAIEQRNGISIERVQEIAEIILHRE